LRHLSLPNEQIQIYFLVGDAEPGMCDLELLIALRYFSPISALVCPDGGCTTGRDAGDFSLVVLPQPASKHGTIIMPNKNDM